MQSSSSSSGDLENQRDKAPQKQSESTKEAKNLTIVVCYGDSSRAHGTTELAQISVLAEKNESPKKVCLSRNGSSHEQCRFQILFLIFLFFLESITMSYSVSHML